MDKIQTMAMNTMIIIGLAFFVGILALFTSLVWYGAWVVWQFIF